MRDVQRPPKIWTCHQLLSGRNIGVSIPDYQRGLLHNRRFLLSDGRDGRTGCRGVLIHCIRYGIGLRMECGSERRGNILGRFLCACSPVLCLCRRDRVADGVGSRMHPVRTRCDSVRSHVDEFDYQRVGNPVEAQQNETEGYDLDFVEKHDYLNSS